MQHLRAPTHNIHAGTQALMRQGLPRRKPRDALPQHGPQLRRHILRLTTRRRDHQHRRALGNRRHRPRARLRDPRDVKIRLTDVREQTRQFRVCSCGFQQTRKHRCGAVYGGVFSGARGILGGHQTNNIRWPVLVTVADPGAVLVVASEVLGALGMSRTLPAVLAP